MQPDRLLGRLNGAQQLNNIGATREQGIRALRFYQSPTTEFSTMRKTLFSILPLLVFLGPTYNRLPLFFGAGLGTTPAAAVESEEMARPVDAIAAEIRSRLGEARRALEELPADTTDFVTLAVAAPDGAGVHMLRLAKEEFLKKNGQIAATTADGVRLTLKVVRPNYVNTAVEVLDEAGRALQPLVVRYPIEKEGRLKEVAYYTSAHPAVGGDEITRAGRQYVHERLNDASALSSTQITSGS
jgi:hypothetical protein